MSQKPFWMVWNERGHAPTYKHETLQSARTEAERLARNNPTHVFHVLSLYGSCAKNDVQWIVRDTQQDMDEEIPF
jgi:hypothetical protein